MNITDMFRTYLTAAGLAARTINLRCYYIDRATVEIGPLDQAADGDLLRWMASQEWSPETRKSVRTSLSVFYQWALEFGHCTSNPASRLPRVKVPGGVPRPVPDQILSSALQGRSDRDQLLIELAAYAGLRRDEIASLKWSALDWSGLTITGKGGRTRQIPLAPILRQHLYIERGMREAGGYGSGWRYAIDPTSPYVFPGNDRGHISGDRVGRILREAMADLYSGHKLRHRFATKAYEVERDLLAVQQLLGHSRPETTARYTAVPQGAALRAVEGTVLLGGDAA